MSDAPPSLVARVDETNKKIDRLADTLEKFVSRGMQMQTEVSGRCDMENLRTARFNPKDNAPPPKLEGKDGAVDLQALYEYVRDRLLRELPQIIRVMAEVPEILIQETRTTIETDTKSAFGMIAKLVAEGFLDQPIKGHGVWKETQRRFSYGGNAARAYEQLDKLHTLGFLIREADGNYIAVPGMKKNIRSVEK